MSHIHLSNGTRRTRTEREWGRKEEEKALCICLSDLEKRKREREKNGGKKKRMIWGCFFSFVRFLSRKKNQTNDNKNDDLTDVTSFFVDFDDCTEINASLKIDKRFFHQMHRFDLLLKITPSGYVTFFFHSDRVLNSQLSNIREREGWPLINWNLVHLNTIAYSLLDHPIKVTQMPEKTP